MLGGLAARGSEVGVEATLELAIGQLAEKMDAIERLLRRPNIQIKTLLASKNFAVGTTIPVLLDFGGTPDGRAFDVDLVSIFLGDPWTAAANVTAVLFVGMPPVAGGAWSPTDVVATGITIPSTASYATRRPVVRNKQHLFALLNGTGLNALSGNLYGVALVSTVPDTDEAMTWL